MCVKKKFFFASTHPYERIYRHYISAPQAFRDPGLLWGVQKKKKRTVFLCCRATLTHSRAPTANFIQCMCHPRCAARGGFYPPCEVCWCHHVIQCTDAISVLQQSSQETTVQSHPQATPHPFTQAGFLHLFFIFKKKKNLI